METVWCQSDCLRPSLPREGEGPSSDNTQQILPTRCLSWSHCETHKRSCRICGFIKTGILFQEFLLISINLLKSFLYSHSRPSVINIGDWCPVLWFWASHSSAAQTMETTPTVWTPSTIVIWWEWPSDAQSPPSCPGEDFWGSQGSLWAPCSALHGRGLHITACGGTAHHVGMPSTAKSFWMRHRHLGRTQTCLIVTPGACGRLLIAYLVRSRSAALHEVFTPNVGGIEYNTFIIQWSHIWKSLSFCSCFLSAGEKIRVNVKRFLFAKVYHSLQQNLEVQMTFWY